MELDEVEKFELLRDVAEHNAMFMNPEGVRQVREAREQTFETPPEDFENMVEEMFGRKFPEVNKQNKGLENIEELKRAINSADKIDPINSLDIELDEVSFTPY